MELLTWFVGSGEGHQSCSVRDGGVCLTWQIPCGKIHGIEGSNASMKVTKSVLRCFGVNRSALFINFHASHGAVCFVNVRLRLKNKVGHSLTRTVTGV